MQKTQKTSLINLCNPQWGCENTFDTKQVVVRWLREIARPAGRAFLLFFGWFRSLTGIKEGSLAAWVGHRESKRGFRVLRDATQGNGAPVLGPWPNESATALRENAPPGPFLVPQGSRKAGESFISPSTRFICAQRGNKDGSGLQVVFFASRTRFCLSGRYA